MPTSINSEEKFFVNLDTIVSENTERKNPDEQTESQYYDPSRKEGEQPKPNPETVTTNTPPKPTIDFEQAGRTTAYLVAGGIETVFTVTESLLFHFGRFSSGEIKRAKEYLDKHEAGEQLTTKEKVLLAKFNRIRDQHDKIRSRIPFPDEDIDQMARGFKEYHKATGKESDPKIILWVTIIRALAIRSTDIFM